MTREVSFELNTHLKQKYKDQIQLKCIADEIWLYCRYLYDNIDIMVEDTNHVFAWEIKENSPSYKDIKKNGYESEFYKELENIYHHVRGETFYIGKKPSAIGTAIFALCCDIHGIFITRATIAKYAALSTGVLYKATELIKDNIHYTRFLPHHWEQTKCNRCRLGVAVFFKKMHMFECSRCGHKWDPTKID